MQVLFKILLRKPKNITLKIHYSIVPLFHYCMSETKTQVSKNLLYFHLVVEIPRR
jgi:hypothetical protein